MWEQINMFRNTTEQIMQLLGTAAGEKLMKNAIYTITMGSNDYLNNYLIEGSPTPMLFTPQQFRDALISTYRQQLTVFRDPNSSPKFRFGVSLNPGVHLRD